MKNIIFLFFLSIGLLVFNGCGEDASITITFQTNGGTTIEDMTLESFDLNQLPETTRTGYQFDGWFIDEALTEPLTMNTTLTSFITLYAKWEMNTYQIIFVTNEGEVIAPLEKSYGQTLDQMPIAERDGYDFIGWYLNETLTEPLNLNTMPAHDITLYAKWASAMITISFDTGGGTSIDDILGSLDDPFTEPLEPTKAGYVFAGWFLAPDATELYQFDVIPSQSMTLYADWATEGLEFVLIEETDTYEVGIGEALDILDVFIPKYYEGKKVTHIMSFGFQDGGDIESIHLPNTITHINQMGFVYAHSLKTIHLPSSLTSIGASAFRFCYGLEAITVDLENHYFESIDGILFSKDLLTLIRYPQAKSGTSYVIPNYVETIAEDAFSSANNLTSIDIGTGVKTIKSHAFFRTSNITSIHIPDQVTTIELYAFRQSYALSSVILGSGLTQISSYMFEGCISLETIIIPNNIMMIGYGAFYDCNNLKEVFIRNTSIINPVTGGLFMFTNTHNTLKIYFADATSLNYYKTAPVWLSYASKMYLGNPPS
jgi:uncharacterized repeat protein (TIGR02543 family)